MQQLENDLRLILTRRPALPGFTERVMKRVRMEPPQRKRRPWQWAMIGAVAASLTVGVFVEKRRAQRARAEAEHASQILLSLQTAGQKINIARDAVLRIEQEELP